MGGPPENPVGAVVVRRAGATPRALLADALASVGRSTVLGPATGDRAEPDCAVVLVALSAAAPVAAAVVHAVVDELADAGWSRIVVGGAVDARDLDNGYDTVAELAHAAGLRGTTAGPTRDGRSYEVLDLRAELTPALTHPGSVLAGRPVSRLWSDAGRRVLVARSVTDVVERFRLTLATLAGVAAPIPGADPGDVVAELYVELPPDLAVVDATISSHGPAGSTRLDPLPTGTLVVGPDALVVDVATASLQGADPYSSPLSAAVRERIGADPHGEIVGELTPFAGWRPANPLLAAAAAPSPVLGRLLAAASGPATEPSRVDPVLRTLRRALTSVWDDPTLLAGLAALVELTGQGQRQTRAWATVFDKSRVDRIEASLGFDPDAYGPADYDAVPGELARLQGLLSGTAALNGLRWRYLDGAVLFEISRSIAAPFAGFVARVDVAAGIGLMADYLGGRVVPIGFDGQGRVVRQAERNVYLPQPNYLSFSGGRPIDVAKIEHVHYGADEHQLSWRTVRSPNGSADCDDGTLSFRADGPDRTRATVFGRQRFTLPAIWRAVDLDRYPDVKDPLVTDAYRRFFTATFDNLEAAYEGRPFRIGRPAASPHAPLPTAALAAGLDLAREWLGEAPLTERLAGLLGAAPGRAPSPAGGELDADGFRHFPGPASVGPTGDRRTPDPWSAAVGELQSGLTRAFTAELDRWR